MTDEYWMQLAIEEARVAETKDEVPVGAVITHENELIARAHNLVETRRDPTAHAEMIAIQVATDVLQVKWLTDCNMYVTIEPCAMCTGALVLARLRRLVIGAMDPKQGACGSLENIGQDPRRNHHLEIVKDVLAEPAQSLIREFFKRRR